MPGAGRAPPRVVFDLAALSLIARRPVRR